MKSTNLCRAVPPWVPMIVVGLMAAAVWGILTVLSSSALQSVPDSMQSIVLVFMSAGNLMTALGTIAFWPLITAAFWCMGVLVVHDEPPEYRELAIAIGMAHLPAMTGVLAVWVIVMLSGLSIPEKALSKEELRQYLEPLLAVRISRGVVAVTFLATAASFIWVVRDFFNTSLNRATAIVVCPLSLYYLSLFVIP